LSYFATDNWSVVQSVLISGSSVTPDRILAEGKSYGADFMVRLPWR